MTDDTTPIEPINEPLELAPVPRALVARQAHAFSSFSQLTEAQQGQTVADIVASLGFPPEYDGFVHVWINDLPLDREEWEHVIPAEGQMVYVRVIPQGGGGGKDVLRTIAAIAIVVVAVATGQAYGVEFASWLTSTTGISISATAATAAITATVSVLGSMALNALIPPPKLELDFGNGLGSQKNQLTGSSNRFAPYAPIPRIFGKRRVYPLLAGRPYSETQGDNEYLRMALLVGWGPLQISDIRIGETPITSFADVQYEVREGWTTDSALSLYTNTITEAGYAILLSPVVGGVTSYNTRTTDTGVTEISVDITAPAGIAKFESNGNRTSIDVDVEVRYAVAGTTNWLTPAWTNSSDAGLDVNGRIRMSGADTSTIRRTGRFTVPAGQYDVRVARTSTEFTPSQHVQEVRWTTMRSVKPSYPVQQSGLALIALRMKATGQLNGVPQQINCLAESYLPVYNGTSWNFEITRNPAWAFADVLRRRGGQTYLPDSRIDLTSILAWANACSAAAPNAAEAYWNFDGVIEGGAVFQVLRQIASSARANYTIRDGKHSVVRDISQTVPIQHITPRNSFGYSGTKVFLDYPHAIRVVFVNAAKNYEEDERIVYDDGYNAANATKFETLELYGCTSATQAYREARYFIAAARLRPETHVVSMDIENLRCNIGDLVRFQHDAVSIGVASARVVSVSGSIIVLDQKIDCTAGASYQIRVRISNGDFVIVTVQNPGTVTTDTFTATSSLAGVAPDDLAMFGTVSSVTAPMIVKRIEPGPDFTAKLHLVDAQAGVYTADTGVIPAFNSNITTTAPVEEQRPGAPTIFSVRSDDTVSLLLPDGTLQVRIAVAITPPTSSILGIEFFDVQWRAVGAVNWVEERYARGTPIFLAPVQDAVSYEIRARAVSVYGVPGNWSGATTHTVSGKSNPPANVTNLSAALKPGVVEIKWDAATDGDYDFTELRYGATWAAGTLLWKGAASTYSWPRPVNATYKIWAAHRDTSGNYSAAPASVDITVTNAIDPQRTLLLTIYRRSPAANTPPLPSVDASYDFGTNVLTGLDNSWQTTPPTGADPLWVSTATTTGNVTDTITPVEWSAATILLQNGTAGLTTAVVELFQRTTTNNAPEVATTGSATYTFSNNSITGQPAGWTTAVPSSGGGYLWVIRATAASTGITDTIDNTEWVAPALVSQDGSPGATGNSTALVYIYQRASTAPDKPSNQVTYTFSTGNIATLNNGWSATVPAGTDKLWVSVASAVSNTGSDTIDANEWSTPVVLVQNGSNGSNTAIVYIYQRAATAPDLPSLQTTYTFSSKALTGLNNGWTATIPAGTNPLYVAAATANSGTDSDTIAANEWSTPVVLAQNGAAGLNSATVFLYQRTATNSAPEVDTTGSTTYTFSNGAVSGQPANWVKEIPSSGGGFLWSIQATASSNTSSDTIANTEWSTPVLTVQNGAQGPAGLNSATVYLFQRTTSATAPDKPSADVTYTFSNGTATGMNNGWEQTMPTTGGAYRWMTTASAASTGAQDTITTAEWATPSLIAQDGSNGQNATQAAIAYLYQWSSAQPGNPDGNSTFTWTSGSHTGYTGTNNWGTSVPANPGTSSVRLWVASKQISAPATTGSSTVSWSSGFSVRAWAANGTNAVQSAQPTVYQWAASIPGGPTGTPTYTWSNGDFGAAPTDWSLTPGTSPSVGFTLWAATVTLNDSAANQSTQFNWNTASITARGYAGTNGTNGVGQQGASARVCYSRIANNPSPTSGTITVTGDGRPTQAQSNATWGLDVAWSATDPAPTSTNSLYQSDGIYNPATGNTVWSTPYISSLKVGSLSAITVNTGNLTVNGTLTVNTGGLVKSANYVANQTGWAVKPDGTAEFIGLTLRDDKGNVIMRSGSSPVNSMPTFSVVRRWDFDGSVVANNSVDGFAFSQITVTASGSLITLTPTGGDPQLITPDNLNIKGSAYDKIQVRIKRIAGTGWDGLCVYKTNSHPLDATGYKYAADGTLLNTWVTLEWDMAALDGGGNDWINSTIQQIRLDFGLSSADRFQIDWIAIGRYSSAPVHQITPENATTFIKALSVDTLQIAGNAVTIPLTFETSTPYNATGTVLTYNFNMPEGGKVIVLWQGQTANANQFFFRIYLNTIPGSGSPAGYVYVGYPNGDYQVEYGTYYYVGAGNGDYIYDPGTPAVPDIGNTRTGGAAEDAPTAIGFGTAVAGANTVRIYWERNGGGTLNYQRLIILGAQR